ncbi:ER membrane protein complex subunit 6 [Anopheles darlingi]|uniref:ER membrane protein complex subunit 6 n=2 Tax=Nyssorhynchus TaxID=44543 RepID=A0A2M4CT17_ANODA|nr:ER membrane protein complex subunit 6 [Anopheles darlingi]
MASTRVKTRETKSGEIIAYSDAAIRNNASAVEYCRTSMAALSGSTAGVLGLTGILGFLFYLLAVLCLWQMLLLKSGSNWQKYFISRKSLLTHGFLSGLCTYVLFWTFLYGMVHVY